MSNYFPFGFQYPVGPSFPYSDKNPDPAIETLKSRVAFLNDCHDHSYLPGEVFAACLKRMQAESGMEVDDYWSVVQKELTPAEVAEVANALGPIYADELPRIDFANAIALVDCRFVSTLEWQHLRRYSIGGSEAAVVVGLVDENGDQINGFTQLSKFQTRRNLAYEKQATFVEVPNAPSKQQIFDYGHLVEPYVIQRAAKEIGAKQYPEYRMFAHRDYPFITCNPDGILVFPDGSLCLFEAKTATRHKKEDWEAAIPAYYIPQPRQYMEVLDDPRIVGGYIGCCFGAGKYDWVLHKYERDWLLGKKQIEIEVKFWQDYIAAGVLPPLSGNAELDMATVYGYGNHNASTMRTTAGTLPSSCETLFQEYAQLKEQRKNISAEHTKAYNYEKELKRTIATQVPEGLTVVKAPNEVSYRISFKKSSIERVNMSALEKDHANEAYLCNRLFLAMAEDGCDFTSPKVTIARTPAKKKKNTVIV